MPRGPKGEKRPANVVSNAILVVKIAAGEVVETVPEEAPKKREPYKKASHAEGRTAKL